VAEHEGYMMKQMGGGQWRYGAESGAHDDTVVACALAWKASQGEVELPDFELVSFKQETAWRVR